MNMETECRDVAWDCERLEKTAFQRDYGTSDSCAHRQSNTQLQNGAALHHVRMMTMETYLRFVNEV